MFHIPAEILAEPKDVPGFWLSTVEEVEGFLAERVNRGRVETIGTSAGGRPLRAALYGIPREGRGTTTFSGSVGCRKVTAWFGTDHEKTVYIGLCGVHGGEFEGIIGAVNLLAVLETGQDLRGKEWPSITAAAERVGRVIVVPMLNVDGRARVPLRMEAHHGRDNTAHEYLNTGGWPDGTNIGWPQCKEFIPLDFTKTGFPGGYPNDAGVNPMHDDFLGTPQPEVRALLDLCARERPDLILNMHTGAPGNNYFLRMHRPFCEPVLTPTFESLYRHVHTGLATEGLQSTDDPALEADPARQSMSVFNLDTALNLHCGCLSVVVESPSHSFSGTNRAGEVVLQTPEMILEAQLVAHREAMVWLAETGGRCSWTPPR